MAADENKGFKLADLGDVDDSRASLLDLLAGFFGGAFVGIVIAIRRDASEVWMIASVQPPASLAFATSGQCGRNGLAEQKRGQLFGECRLADSGWPDQERRMRKPVESLPE